MMSSENPACTGVLSNSALRVGAQESATDGSGGKNLIADFAKLDRRLDQRRKKRRFAPIGSTLSAQRLAELERYLGWRYGHVLPDDDAGRDDLHVLLSVAKAAGKPAMDFVRKWAPWMRLNDARRACLNADLGTAYLKADPMADRLGIPCAVRDALRLRTIGSTDVRKPERERRRRRRYDSKRKKAKAAKAPKPALKPREQATMRMVGRMIGMGDLARKAKRHRLFQHLENVPLEVRRIVDRLVKAGHLGKRLEPRRERGGTEWFIWREQASGQPDKRDMSQMSQTKETAAPQALPENAPRQTSIFIGSNRGADSCVNTPEGGMEMHDLDGAEIGNLGSVAYQVADTVPKRAPCSRGLRAALNSTGDWTS